MAGITPDELRELALEEQRTQHYMLVQRRLRDGYECFITDLKGFKDQDLNTKHAKLGIRAKDSRHWQLVEHPAGATINIDMQTADDKDFKEIHDLLNSVLGSQPWFKAPTGKVASREERIINPHPNVPKEYYTFEDKLLVKTLGYNCENPAVDPIILVIGEDGKLKVLAGQRPVGTAWAFPGGMVEGNVKKTCLNEVLEECFGGSLFDGESQNSKEADKLFKDNPKEFEARVAKCLQEKELAISAEMAKRIQATFMGVGSINQKLGLVARMLGSQGKEPAEVDHQMLRLKCKLFEHLFPKEFADFQKFVADRLTKMDKFENQADPRNTPLAHMRTTPLIGLFNHSELNDIAAKCGLQLKGGDDLVGPQLVDVEKFITDPFSDHGTYIMRAIAMKIESGELDLDANPKIAEQIMKMQEIVLAKSAEASKGAAPEAIIEAARAVVSSRRRLSGSMT